MVQPVHHRFSFATYLQVESDSGIKHEFLDGAVWAMSGGTPTHARIAANIVGALTRQLAGRRCAVFSADLRIRVIATGLATYPDLSVVCGQLEYDPEDSSKHTVSNPKLIVEVLSPSTEDYDRGEKLEHYKQIESLETIVLVEQDVRRVDVWTRNPQGWTPSSAADGGTIELASIDCKLALDDVYRDPLA